MVASLLESLPTELILHLTSFIPSHSTSIRPRNSLLSLSQSSRHLHALLHPSINEHVQFHCEAQLESFFSAAEELITERRRNVRTIALLPRTNRAGKGSERRHESWSVATLKKVIRMTQEEEIRELSLAGVDFNSVYEAMEELARTSVPTRNSLERLRIEFARDVELDSNSVLVSGATTHVPGSTAFRNGGTTTTDATSHDHLLRTIFALFPNLLSVSLINLTSSTSSRPHSRSSSPVPTPDFATYTASPLRLLHLSLTNCTVSPPTITSLLSSCYSTLEKIELVNCSEKLLEDKGVMEQLGRCERMKNLKIICSSDRTVNIGSSTSRSSSPETSSTSPAKKKGIDGRTSPHLTRRSSNGKEMAGEDLPILDKILPSFPHLKHLVAHPTHSTQLYSNELFDRLSTLTPRLHSLSLTLSLAQNLRPSSLLPLLRSDSPLEMLRHVEIISPSSLSPLNETSTVTATSLALGDWNEEIRDLWGAAVDKDVEVSGSLWKDAVGKWVEWAEGEEKERNDVDARVVGLADVRVAGAGTEEGRKRKKAGRRPPVVVVA